jgi:hypothetical protein
MDKRRLLIGFLAIALAACSTAVRRDDLASACAKSESSYECQVERYLNVNVD